MPRLCSKGLHDLDVPANLKVRKGGRKAECRPCAVESHKAWRYARRGLCAARLHDMSLPGAVRVRRNGFRDCRACMEARRSRPRTHCAAGHPIEDPASVVIWKDGRVRCRACLKAEAARPERIALSRKSSRRRYATRAERPAVVRHGLCAKGLHDLTLPGATVGPFAQCTACRSTARSSEDQRQKQRVREEAYYADPRHRAHRAQRMADAYNADLDASRAKVRERARQWRARATPEEIDALRERVRLRRLANPATPRSRMDLTEVENARSRDRAYYHADRLHSLERQHRRRAAKVGADVRRVTSRDLERLWSAWGGRCAYCGAGAETIEHVMPLSRGGRHAIGNLIPACSRCNPGKGWKFVREWKHGRTALGYVPPQRRGRRALRPIA